MHMRVKLKYNIWNKYGNEMKRKASLRSGRKVSRKN